MPLDDALDRAIDAAEAHLESAESGPVEESQTEAPEPQEESPEETAYVAKKVLDKSPQRDEKGKFTKAQTSKPEKNAKRIVQAQQISDQEADVQNPEVVPEPSEAQEPPIEVPTFWSAEDKAAFAQAPKQVQAAIVKYENNRNEWANRVQSEVQKAKQYEARASEMFGPYEAELRAAGFKDPLEAANALLGWNDLIKKDPVTACLDILARNGKNPYDLIDGYEDVSNQQPAYSDPRVDDALREAQEAKQQLEEYRKQIDAQAASAQLESFKNGVDSTGQRRSQYFDLYRPQIAQAMKEIVDARPDLTESDALHHAYEYVIGEARKAFGVKATGARPQPSTVDVTKAKAAASSVRTAPSNGVGTTRPKAKTFDEAFELAEEALGLR